VRNILNEKNLVALPDNIGSIFVSFLKLKAEKPRSFKLWSLKNHINAIQTLQHPLASFLVQILVQLQISVKHAPRFCHY
jgi:hypothetical protein